MDQELKLYRDELIRLRYLLEQAYNPVFNDNMSDGMPTTGRPSANVVPTGPLATNNSQTQNYSQPSILGSTGVTSGANFKAQSNSQTNFFPASQVNDATSNLSHQHVGSINTNAVPKNGITLSHEDVCD